MIKIKGFKFKLILSYILVILIPLSFIFVTLGKKLEEKALEDIKSSLISQSHLIENQIPQSLLGAQNYESLASLIKNLAAKISLRITIIDSSGKVLADSEKNKEEVFNMENHALRAEVMLALNKNIAEEVRYSDSLKINMLYVAIPIAKSQEVLGVVRVALPLKSVEETLWTTRKIIIFSLFFALALASVLVSVLSKTIVDPIKKLIFASKKFAKGDFSYKIHQRNDDELGQLALTLNNMSSSIEEKIRQVEFQNEQLKNIFQSMVEGIIVVDYKTQIVTVNNAAEKIFNINKDTVQGKLFLEAVANNALGEIINMVLGKGELLQNELSIVWPVNKIFRINAAPIFEQSVVKGCLLVVHDITEIRKLETVRKDFVANVSHELKTPLTSIKGFVETLLEGALDDKENAKYFLKIIDEHTNRLSSLINDLLELSYLESKAVKLVVTKMNISVLVNKVISGFKVQAKNNNVKIINSLSDDLIFNVDGHKVEQVFTNLIDNAIKFNKKDGQVKIYSEDLKQHIRIVVEDSGSGIPPEDIGRIFERFYRVDKMRSKEMGGTGLGLAIVKHIVELHDGRVGVESIEGLGSKFWFILPK